MQSTLALVGSAQCSSLAAAAPQGTTQAALDKLEGRALCSLLDVLQRALGHNDSAAQRLCATGLPHLVALLSHGDAAVRSGAVLCVQLLCQNGTDALTAVSACGALPLLAAVLRDGEHGTTQNAALVGAAAVIVDQPALRELLWRASVR